MRPTSILWFERLFLAAIVIGVVNSLLAWDSFAETEAMLGTGFVIGTLVVSNGINLLLWYFIAQRGSNVARWILIVLFGLGVASLLFTVTMGTYPAGSVGALGAVAWVLQAAAVFFLFRPDAMAWSRYEDDVQDTFE